jgi:hypothetical protein
MRRSAASNEETQIRRAEGYQLFKFSLGAGVCQEVEIVHDKIQWTFQALGGTCEGGE